MTAALVLAFILNCIFVYLKFVKKDGNCSDLFKTMLQINWYMFNVGTSIGCFFVLGAMYFLMSQ